MTVTTLPEPSGDDLDGVCRVLAGECPRQVRAAAGEGEAGEGHGAVPADDEAVAPPALLPQQVQGGDKAAPVILPPHMHHSCQCATVSQPALNTDLQW